ncbi:hypothetical protein RUND412_000042 [Rhizina undulata]
MSEMSDFFHAKCGFCRKPHETTSSHPCLKCQIVSYCSKTCQIADHQIHHLICSQLQEDETIPPDPDTKPNDKPPFRALFFPENDTCPKIVYIPTITDGGVEMGKTVVYQLPSISRYRCGPQYHIICRNELRRRNLKHNLIVYYREAFLIDGSKSNVAVMNAVGGRTNHPWRGPILVMKDIGTSRNISEIFCDLEIADFRDVIDWLGYHDEGINGEDYPIHIRADDRWKAAFLRFMRSSGSASQALIGLVLLGWVLGLVWDLFMALF